MKSRIELATKVEAPAAQRTVKHPPHQEGSRRHVLSWHGGNRDGEWTSWRTCSEPNCEINDEQSRR